MHSLFSRFLSIGGDKRIKAYNAKLDAIASLEPSMQEKSDDGLRLLADSLRERAASGESLDKLLIEAFALVREASCRTIGLRHFDVQLIGAMALNDGAVAEMRTGEGKTLVSTAAGFLNALGGDNVHIVTVNDYLAKRDSEWMGRIYRFLGMEVGLIQNGMRSDERKPAYEAAVTYGTNSEFGFDYLRDNTVSTPKARVQRGHSFAIVDEVDSILIDEARTPLIISGLGDAPAELYGSFAQAVRSLVSEEDYVLDEKRRTIYATEEGLDKIEDRLRQDIYADATGALANHLRQALSAEYLFRRDSQYIVAGGEVRIVDEFTGRVMEGRRFSEGLHQAIEAKEGVIVQRETHTLATVTLQNYFRMYEKLSGMTGTALTEDSEFKHIYNLPVVPIPTNKPVIRKDRDDLVFRTSDARDRAVVREVAERQAKGQPVLVGTTSVEASESLSRLFRSEGIRHEVLNAKNPEQEAAIIAQAGRKGAVTIATNMAGRGTDILLGGSYDQRYAEALAKFRVSEETAADWQRQAAHDEAAHLLEVDGYEVRLAGGLCVIGTERHESRRIDNQLRGRAGRQGDPGESRFFLSLEDDLLRRFGGDRLDAVSDMMVKKGIPDEEPLEDPLVSRTIGAAQQQVESMHFATRKQVLEYDDVMDLQRKAIYQERNALLDGKKVMELLPKVAQDLIEEEAAFCCPDDLPDDDWDWKALGAWFASMTGDEDFDIKDRGYDDASLVAATILESFDSLLQDKASHFGDQAFEELCRSMLLSMMDKRWIEHLTAMDYLKKGIGLRSFGHRDPLVEYKQDAYDAFGAMTSSVYEDFLRGVLRMPLPEGGPVDLLPGALPEAASPFAPEDMIYTGPEEGDAS